MNDDDARQRARDRSLLDTGGGLGRSIERPGGTFGVSVFRSGVRPIGIGGVYLAPIWFYRRLRWQLGSKRWSVEARVGREHVLTTVVSVEEFDSKAEAVERALEMVDDARAGTYDGELPA